MDRPRGKSAALFAASGGVLVIVTLMSYSREIGRWYRFVSTFERVGENVAGQTQYRHRETGVLMVRTPDGNLFTFRGKVSRGQHFTRQVTRRLWFRLDAENDGWNIAVGFGAQRREDFASVVTLPFYGPGPLRINGWNFRNSDNTGPNGLGPKNVNAPGRHRDFDFVLNDTDHQKAFGAMRRKEYSEIRAALEKGKGVLTITRMKLGNLIPGQAAWIESMEFDVELCVPTP